MDLTAHAPDAVRPLVRRAPRARHPTSREHPVANSTDTLADMQDIQRLGSLPRRVSNGAPVPYTRTQDSTVRRRKHARDVVGLGACLAHEVSVCELDRVSCPRVDVFVRRSSCSWATESPSAMQEDVGERA